MGKYKKVDLKSGPKKVYRQYIELLRPFHGLSKREMDVLGSLLYKNDSLRKEIPNDKHRIQIVMGYDSRVEICDDLGITRNALEGYFAHLKRKGALTKDGYIAPAYSVEIDTDKDDFYLVFRLNINENENNETE